MNSTARNMYVFRDGRRSEPGRTLVDALAAELRSLPSDPTYAACDHLIGPLLRAGEIECALADLHSPEAARLLRITDSLAAALVWSSRPLLRNESRPSLSSAELIESLPRDVPDTLTISPPEGFVYYALHPLDFVDLAERFSFTPAAVIGIRSIGTTLSALVAAALSRRGMRISRITVRPIGHPYDRRTELTSEQLRWVAAQRAGEAEFLVVDEGPGMSGSSFLSVGEALLGAGVAREHIHFLCSREPNPDMLCARDARERWLGFRAHYAYANSHLPPQARIYVGGGHWREHLYSDPSNWPASWTQMERLKFLSPDKRTLFKFEGLGRFGSEVHRRAQLLGEAGFSPAPQGFLDGFGRYPMVPGAMLQATSINRELLLRMAAYCAFRAMAMRSADGQQPQAIEDMVRFNVREEFGIELEEVGPFHAAIPVIVDGRMLPHEWRQTSDGSILKLDGTSHGDDHFFPGPTDIAWDLAGAIAEWNLRGEAADYLIQQYRRRTGDDPRRRLPGFLLAYTVFRMAYCKMAADTVCGSGEEFRLLRDYRHYRELALAQLPSLVQLAS
ncbi:MAG: hypothetical protein ACE14M_00880 [Terriglobales bacterium]